LVSGYEQAFGERAPGGASWAAYFKGQQTVWYLQGMWWRQFWGYVTAAGLVLLIWDLCTVGKGETRAMVMPESAEEKAVA